jgi:hypothetical protein
MLECVRTPDCFLTCPVYSVCQPGVQQMPLAAGRWAGVVSLDRGGPYAMRWLQPKFVHVLSLAIGRRLLSHVELAGGRVLCFAGSVCVASRVFFAQCVPQMP